MTDQQDKQDKKTGSRGITRREFAAGGVNIALLTALGGLAACKVRSDSLDEGRVKASGSGKIRERKSLWDLQANSPDIILYRAAIDKMVSVPQEKDGSYDPMSWEGQARIHMDSCPARQRLFSPLASPVPV